MATTNATYAQTELAKIDHLATDGLGGISDSLSYRIGEVERHFHSYERWFGVAASVSASHKADQIAKDIASFQIDAGDDAYGDWVQLLGSADTSQKYDFHKLFITAAQTASTVHFIQIAFGATGDGAVGAGTYTEFVYRSGAAVSREAPVVIQCRRQAAGTLAWARVLAYDVNTSTVNFYFGLHLDEG